MRQANGRHLPYRKHLGGLEPGVPGDHIAIVVDEDWIGPAVRLDAPSDHLDLCPRVDARIAGIGL